MYTVYRMSVFGLPKDRALPNACIWYGIFTECAPPNSWAKSGFGSCHSSLSELTHSRCNRNVCESLLSLSKAQVARVCCEYLKILVTLASRLSVPVSSRPLVDCLGLGNPWLISFTDFFAHVTYGIDFGEHRY